MTTKTNGKTKFHYVPQFEGFIHIPKTKQEKYQAVLNAEYGGTVTAVERYINPKAVILHRCSECGQDFYAKPMWIIGNPSQRHLCGMRYGDQSGNRSDRNKSITANKSRAKISEETKQIIIKMYQQGHSERGIAAQLGLNRESVRYHIRKAREQGLGV